MSRHSPIIPILIFFILLWAVFMVLIGRDYTQKSRETEKNAIRSDVTFTNEERSSFSIMRNGVKVGYRRESLVPRPGMYLFIDETVLKMNLSGMSREVFFQSVAAIDSVTRITRQMSFTLSSGTHTYSFDGSLSADTLSIKVKKNTLDPQRTGSFIVNEQTTYPIVLPYYLHQSETELMSYQIFDPVIFSDYLVHAQRTGIEVRTIDGKPTNLTRYDLRYQDRSGVMWLDSGGRLASADSYPLLGGLTGDFTLEKASGDEVFLLPLEVSFGMDVLRAVSIQPDENIVNPRTLHSLEVEVDGIRAANIDTSDPSKEFLSANPVIFRIHDEPISTGDRLKFERELVTADTSLTGSSDYIQPHDARILRAAREAAGALTDTLAIANALCRQVNTMMQPMEGLAIVRSVDILRERKGGCDEYTKLFTALSRSLGIPTQINMGLVYRDGTFRYHSWPSVFIKGTWHSLDPWFGQERADATHIALVRGDFERLVEMIRIIGLISIHLRAMG
jgi:hypothetical protein